MIRSRPPSKEYDQEFDRIFRGSSVVEQGIVNPLVEGSIPSPGAIEREAVHKNEQGS